jgi:hypothetical protein
MLRSNRHRHDENAPTTAQMAVRSLIDLCANDEFGPELQTANAALMRKSIASQAVVAAVEKALEAVGGGGFRPRRWPTPSPGEDRLTAGASGGASLTLAPALPAAKEATRWRYSARGPRGCPVPQLEVGDHVDDIWTRLGAAGASRHLIDQMLDSVQLMVRWNQCLDIHERQDSRLQVLPFT